MIHNVSGYKSIAALLFPILILAGCGDGGSSNRQAYDDGGRERISILSSTQTLDPDSAIASLPVVLPRPYTNGN